jgi:hypothetical protein
MLGTLLVLATLIGDPAPADAPAVGAAAAGVAPAAESLSHRLQLGVSLAPGVGYRVIFPYSDGQFCGTAGKRVCTSHLPAFLELEAAFGVSTSVDLIADFRFGAESDFNTQHDFFFAPGIKYYVDAERAFKLYTTFQLVFDSEDQPGSNVDSFDFALRNANGLQYEFLRYLGLFAQFGETLGVVRWLRFELDFAGGVQGRFP